MIAGLARFAGLNPEINWLVFQGTGPTFYRVHGGLVASVWETLGGNGQAASAAAVLLAQQQPQGGNPVQLIFPMVAIMLLGYFMFLRPQQVKERRYREMIDSLKERDQVVTLGGIHGVITGVQRDANRVTLRVDDATGAKIRVDLSAISHVVGDDKQGAGDRDKNKKPEAKTKT